MAELEYGTPTHPPLSHHEFMEWLAILTVVEPYEHEKANAKAKGAPRGRRGGRRGRRR